MMNEKEGLDLSWLTEGSTSLPELIDSVYRGSESTTQNNQARIPLCKGRMWTDGTKEELSLLSAGYIVPLDHEEGVPYTGPESPDWEPQTKVIINGWLSSSSCFLVTTEAEPKQARRAHTLVVLYLAGGRRVKVPIRGLSRILARKCNSNS